MSLKYAELKPVTQGYKKVYELLKSTFELIVKSSNVRDNRNTIIYNISSARDEETECVNTLKEMNN